MALKKFKKGRKLPTILSTLLVVSILLGVFSPVFEGFLAKYAYADYKPDWGVLAVNTNKSVYGVGDTAKFEYAVLDDFGGMVCSAKVEMRLTNEELDIEEVFSTENGRIRVNEECNKKEYVEVPDFESTYVLEKSGIYQMEVTAEITAGKYTISDTFMVAKARDLDVERVAPTRIYPPENYPVVLKVTTGTDFQGLVTDRVPLDFEIVGGFDFTVEEKIEEGYKEIVWDVDWERGNSYELSYEFKAPEKSPEYYELGKLSFVKENSWLKIFGINSQVVFEESRNWQIASDAANDAYIFWDDVLGGAVPGGWTSESDAAETYENVFLRGANTAGGTSGTTTHNHTPAVSNVSTFSTLSRKKGTGTQAGVGSHTHSAATITSVAASNLPAYSTLMVIKSSGTPTQIPQYGIALFDAAPGGGGSWTRYSTQDGNYVYGGAAAGTTGGNASNAHTHNTTSISLTTNSGSTSEKEGNNSNFLGTVNTHTHSSSDVTSTSDTVEPPYIDTLLYYPTTTAEDVPTGLIAMFDAAVPTDWVSLSGTSGAFEDVFIKPNSTYGGTGGQSTAHTHAGVAGGTSDGGAGSFDDEGVNGPTIVLETHTHTFDVGLSTLGGETYLPPYIDVVVGKYSPASVIYTQNDFEWFVTTGSVTLTDEWPSGAIDIAEITPLSQIPATNIPLTNTSQVRLQMNFTVTSSLLAASGEDFQLEYDTATDCTAATGWADVGDTGSGTIWRLFDQSGLADGDTQVNDITTSDVTAEGDYSETNPSQTNPNQIEVNEDSEWDWPLENNGAVDNTTYCFRMVVEDGGSGSSFPFYNSDSYPKLTTAPVTANLLRHGNIFSDDGEQGFFWAN